MYLYIIDMYPTIVILLHLNHDSLKNHINIKILSIQCYYNKLIILQYYYIIVIFKNIILYPMQDILFL